MSKRAIVLGAGLMGAEIARDLASDPAIDRVTVMDVDQGRLARLAAASAKIDGCSLDVTDTEALADAIAGHDVAAASLPHGCGLGALQAAIAAAVPVVDIAGPQPEARLALDEAANRAGIVVIPGCGLAPGLSNILAYRAAMELEDPESIIIKVGGLPQHPVPPFNYRVVYTVETVLETCAEPALVIRDGRITRVPALSDLETCRFPDPVGEAECFITDGLATLPYTLRDRGLRRLEEKTVRYPGFCRQLTFLRDCGLLSTDPVSTPAGVTVRPRDLLQAVLEPLWRRGDERDLVAMRIEAEGRHDGAGVRLVYDLMDFYDETAGVTSMARTTAYPCTIACRLILQGRITGSGVLPPEVALGRDDGNFEHLLQGLAARGVKILRSREPS